MLNSIFNYIFLSLILVCNTVVTSAASTAKKPLSENPVKSDSTISVQKPVIKNKKSHAELNTKKNMYLVNKKKSSDQKTTRKILSTDTDKSAEVAINKVDNQLKAISKLCQLTSLSAQINQLENSLSTLRKVITEQLDNNHDLDISTGIFFRDVFNVVAKPGLFTAEEKLTVKVIKKEKLNLLTNFLHNYQIEHNTDIIRNLNQFRHEWAKNVYQGLKCIQLPHGDTV